MRDSIERLLSFARDRRGAVSAMTLTAVPVMVASLGMAVDYSRATNALQQLQQAVDSAALALTNAQVRDVPRPDSDARLFVEANLENRQTMTLGDVKVVQEGRGYARVTATAVVENFFLGFAGVEEWTINAVSVAEFDDAQNVDLYILLDNSPSMLIGATPADMAGIGSVSQRHGEGNCAFACHYAGRDTYTEAHAEGWTTRLDAAKAAIKDALAIGSEISDVADYEINVWIKAFTREYFDIAEGSVDEVRRSGVVDTIEPIDKPSQHIYEQSDHDMALTRAEQDFRKIRKESPDHAAYMIWITDGVVDARRGGREIKPIDPSWCDRVKGYGVKIGVIYTTYFEIPSNGFWNSNVKPFTHKIAPNLEACASAGWFFEAQYEDDIHAALEKLMKLAAPSPTLTQ